MSASSSSYSNHSKESEQLTVPCPQCQKLIILQQSQHRPFCSKRCQMIDRGAWVSGEYFIVGDQESSHQNLSDE